MPEVLVILATSATDAQRAAVISAAPAAQTISQRVFTSAGGNAAQLRSMAGIAAVLTGGEPVESLPTLSDTEALFAHAWLSRAGQTKQRPGDGLSWDTPPMVPPDPPRKP
ncbi:MAG TPA: hypothetical protein VHP37_21400 [Burkholderiales bacterium]|nr:hypothetical protein [Burkholderiales bacterium]